MQHLHRPFRHRRRLLAATAVLTAMPLIAVGMIRAGTAHTANSPTVVSIEFDDGYSDQLQALPMLSSHSMHATFFINSGSPGMTNYMAWSDVHTVANGGNEIGGHTVSHVNLTQVSTDEATRQVCNDRVNLANQGFASVTDFAYPYGANNATVQGIVQGCGYNSARDVKGLVSPSGCSGCPYAESIPPANYYDTRTSDNITSDMSLATIEGEVTQAQQNGGGWVQLVFHHVCAGCDQYAVTPTNLSALLDWLQQQESNNTTIQTVNQVIGGPVQPVVSGPPPPANQPLQNPSLETDSSPADGVPDCWSTGTTGTVTATFSRTNNAHTGSWAEQINVSSLQGQSDAKIVTQQDLGQCAYSITVGQGYQLSEWYKGSGQIVMVVYARNPLGGWSFCNQAKFFNPSSATWTQAIFDWSQPSTGNCATGSFTPTAISFGLALDSAGSLTVDDAAIGPGPIDTSPPTTTISCNGTTCSSNAYTGTVTIALNATDTGGSGVCQTRYTTDGSSVSNTSGTVYTGPFPITATSTITYRSWDCAGNPESFSHAKTVNVTSDTTPPTSAIACNGGSCSGWFGAGGASVSLSATDTGGSGLKAIYYTTDGSTPTTSSPVYTGPFQITSTKTVQFFAQDNAGNQETPAHSQSVQVDGVAPTTTASCNGSGCAGWYTTTPVTVSLSASDNQGGSGVTKTYYTTDGSTPTTSSAVYNSPLTISSTTTLKFFSVDAAGNQESVNTQQVQLDTAAPVSTISCGGNCSGWFNSAGASVTLSAADTGGSGVQAIYYTTDGSTPTTNSTVYTAPFTVTSTSTVKFFSVDNAGNQEQVNSQPVQVDATAPTSQISCGGSCGGWFGAAGPTVTLSATDDSNGSGVAAIYYTTDGSAPTTNGTAYSGPFTVSSTSTVRFFAVDVAGNQEQVHAQPVRVDAAAPKTAAVCGSNSCSGWFGVSGTNVTLTATDTDSGVATTYYTTDGSTPTTSSPVYKGPIPVTSPTNLKFFSVDNSGNQEQVENQSLQIDTSPPTSSISCNDAACSSGWVGSGVSVSLSAGDTGGSGIAAIYYTTDGSTPTTSSAVYTSPFTVTSTSTVKFFSVDVAGNQEQVNSQLLQVDSVAPATTISCNGGSCSGFFTSPGAAVTLNATDSGSGIASIYYTTDGTTPTTSSPAYTGAFTLDTTATVKFFAVDNAGNQEQVESQVVQVDALAPTSSIACNGGSCNGWFGAAGASTALTATDGTGSGVKAIYYTTDGTDPTENSAVYNGPFQLTSTVTVKFRSVDNAGNLESVNTQLIQVDSTPPVSSIACNGVGCTGWYNAPLTVTLSATDTDSGIKSTYYTTDGSNPTTSSPVYAGPFTVSSPTTVKFRSVDQVGNLENTKTQQVQFDSTPPVTTISCNSAACKSGWYTTSPITVSLAASDNTGGSGVTKTYYTTDGTTPTTSSPVYTAPFTVSSTTTVKFRSQDTASNLEQVESQLIQIDVTAPTTTATCNSLPCTTWFAGTVTMVLTATDGSGSGIAVTRYTLDGSTPTTSSPVYSTPLEFTATKTVKFRSWDNVGNVEAVKQAIAQVDTIAPTIAITSPANNSKVSGNVVIKTNAADTGGSGVASVAFYVDGVLIGTDTSSPWQFNWNTKGASKGSHKLTAVAKDGSGNKTTSAVITVTVS